jgi:hypothetical protein
MCEYKPCSKVLEQLEQDFERIVVVEEGSTAEIVEMGLGYRNRWVRPPLNELITVAGLAVQRVLHVVAGVYRVRLPFQEGGYREVLEKVGFGEKGE